MTEENKIKEKKYVSADEKIALRNSWLKIGVIGSVTTVFAVKIALADFTQAFSGFEFSDLLSLFLAIFSISLAVLFYFKATETSNTFYNNTYRFTKDVSEILGRVEASFGERLRNLDEGYTGLKSAFEKIPFDRAQADKEINEEKEQLKKVEKVEKERTAIIEDLAKRAQLQEEEKSDLFIRLEEQDKELSNARRDLRLLQQQFQEAEIMDKNEEWVRQYPPHMRRYISFRHMAPPHIKQILSTEIIPRLSKNFFQEPIDIVAMRFNKLCEQFAPQIIEELKIFEVVDSRGYLTRKGYKLIESIKEAS